MAGRASADFRELVRAKLGDARVTEIDSGAPRLLCIAGEFLRQDRIAAENSRRRIELLRYRRFGDAYVALEWVYGGEAVEPPPRPTALDPPPRPSPRGAGEDPDYTIYEPWNKTSEETRTLFRELQTLAESLGSVRTDVFVSEMSFKCMAAPGKRPPVVAYVHLLVQKGIRVYTYEKHVRDIPQEDGFTRPWGRGGRFREITIRDRKHIRKVEPLLRAAYERLSE